MERVNGIHRSKFGRCLTVDFRSDTDQALHRLMDMDTPPPPESIQPFGELVTVLESLGRASERLGTTVNHLCERASHGANA